MVFENSRGGREYWPKTLKWMLVIKAPPTVTPPYNLDLVSLIMPFYKPMHLYSEVLLPDVTNISLRHTPSLLSLLTRVTLAAWAVKESILSVTGYEYYRPSRQEDTIFTCSLMGHSAPLWRRDSKDAILKHCLPPHLDFQRLYLVHGFFLRVFVWFLVVDW